MKRLYLLLFLTLSQLGRAHAEVCTKTSLLQKFDSEKGITIAEIQRQHTEHFNSCTDNKSTVTLEEYLDMERRALLDQTELSPNLKQLAENDFHKMDSNEDLKVSVTEYVHYLTEESRMMDLDQDQNISPEEFQISLKKAFEPLKVTKEKIDEAQALVERETGESREELIENAATLRRQHIDAHIPATDKFDNFMKRDLQAYLGVVSSSEVKTYYEVLSKPAQLGVGLPKFYVWVEILRNKQLVRYGVCYVAARDREVFDILHFYNGEQLKENSADLPDEIVRKALLLKAEADSYSLDGNATRKRN